ncbi:MAG: cation:proton antiporter [Prolixibacteraceae bacterium]|nr:cation:proton antiporter [Prolixibacteraceae bacterium]MBN2772994.1 cation:proton antiporter [Prolixibacteraceae bacterium]
MYEKDFFFQALIYLVAAVFTVPLAKKLGLGSVLGYLFAGVLIGPFIFNLVGPDSTSVMHFAEFGVVLMLFIIGLELEPKILWKMRRSVFGLGSAQVLFTTLAIAGIALILKFKLSSAIAFGLILSLSSTAIVLQTLNEKGLIKNKAGRMAFSVLLFQDMSVIPIIALIPLLATLGVEDIVSVSSEPLHGQSSAISHFPAWLQIIIIVGVISLIVVIGKFIAHYIFRLIAETGLREVFTATSLLLVIGTALAMDKIGLSPALGTFLAGVVLADSEYRHELEITIEPFKGILLGLFFISVGASINFQILFNNPAMVISFVLLLIVIKFIVLYLLSKSIRLNKGQGLMFAFSLAQASEFAFVLISFSSQNGLFDNQTSGMLLIIVTLSMVISPLLLILNEKLISPFISGKQNKEESDIPDETDSQIIIAGFGRFGLTVGRLLIANNFKVTLIDSNPSNIELLRRYGFKLFYGDVTRPPVLEKAGIHNARILILSMAEYDDALKVAEFVKKNYPEVKILARAKDIFHVFEFFRLGIKTVQQENFNSAAELGAKALSELGFTKFQAYRAARTFKHHEEEILQELYKHWQEDESHFIQETRRLSQEIKETLDAEKNFSIHESDCAWDADSLRKEALEKSSQEDTGFEI